MSDAEWAVVRQAFPTPAWMESRGGRPEGHCHRQILDAGRYPVDNGIKWRSPPADFPPWARVYAFFRRWRDHGLIRTNCMTGCVRVSAGRRAAGRSRQQPSWTRSR